MTINPNIFKAYDIRGKFPSEVNQGVAELVGNASAAYLARKQRRKSLTFFVCRDVRNSSPELMSAIVRGILAQGSNVIDAGIGTTPYFYYLMKTKKIDAGIMVTASHNPPEYNGFKVRGKNGDAIALSSGLEVIQKQVMRGKFERAKMPGEMLPGEDYREEYIEFLARKIISKKIRVVVDAAGGSTALFLPRLLAKLGAIDYKPLFFEPDGAFKKHHPNPLLPDSQKFAKDELKKGGYHFGVVFDGDGDRIVFLDEKGNFVSSDIILALLADEGLKKGRKNSFVLTVNTSRGVREYIQARKGSVKLSPVGYVHVQNAMKKAKALFGAELSGHFYFKEFFYDDSAILAFLKVAELLSNYQKPLSRLVEPISDYITSGEVNIPVENKKAVLSAIKKYFRKAKLNLIDGITAEFDDWWFNIRPSNTEPVIRLVLEAKDKKLFDEKMGEVRSLLKSR